MNEQPPGRYDVMQITHEAREPLERARDPDMRVNLDEDTLGCMNIHLQQASLVKRRIEQC